jgi:outer membrane protein assembly factor BamB
MKLYIILILCFFANFANSVHSAEIKQWSHLLGADYNADAGPMKLFIPSDEKVPVLWKIGVGQGYSGSVIVDGRLYTQAQSRSGQFVLCMDVLTGATLWRTRYGWPYELDGDYPGTYGTPTYSDGKIYFTGCYGTVGCIDALTGKILWSLDLKTRFQTEVTSFGYACTPLVKNGKVYLTLNGDVNASVIALNANDGSSIWQSGSFPASYSSPLPFSYNNQEMIVSFLRNCLVGNDPKTGKLLWKFNFSKGYDEHSAWPLFKDDMIFCASPFFKGMRALKIQDENSGENNFRVSEIWCKKDMSNDIFSSVIHGRYIYGFHITDPQANPECNTDGFFKCLDINTGKEQWSTDKTGHVHTIIVGDKLILLSEDGTLIYAEASPDKYSELWRGKLFYDKRCWTLPAVWNGRIFLRGGDEIISLAIREDLVEKEEKFVMIIPVFSVIGTLNHYLKEYDTEDFISPSISLCFLWFLYSVLIFAVAGVVSYFFKTARMYAFELFIAISITLGISLSLFLSALHGRFIFTLPLVIFSCFLVVLKVRQKQLNNNNRVIPRIVLGGFIVISAIYFYLCSRLFITSGFAFPFGLIPAILPAMFFMKFMSEEKRKTAKIALFFLAYAIYFWSAVALMVCRTSISVF